MSEETFNLDRQTNVEKRIDALGKKWEVHSNRGSSLCFARPNPDRSDAVIPKIMKGLWTKPSMLTEQIDQHVKTSWDEAEAAQLRAERVKIAAQENAKKEAEKGFLEKLSG